MQRRAYFLGVLLLLVAKFKVTSAITCGYPPLVGSAISNTTRFLHYKEQATYTCKNGFRMTSSSFPAYRICTANGTFIGPDFSCKVITCKTNLAPKMDNAVHNGTKEKYRHGKCLAYKCQEGYSDSQNRTSQCVCCSDKWRYIYKYDTKLNCTEVRCDMPPNINHAEYFNLVHLTDTNITTMATATNTTMTTATDTTMTTATDTTMTTATITTINPSTESSTSIPSNPAEFWLYNATVKYECIQGFVPIYSSNMSRCQQNSSWSPVNLICVEQGITTIDTTSVQNFPSLSHTADSTTAPSPNNTILSDITNASNNTEAFTFTLMIRSWDTTYDSQLITLSPSSLSQDNTIDYTSIISSLNGLSSYTNEAVSTVSMMARLTDVSSTQSSNITMTITSSGADNTTASTDSFSYVSSTSISDHISESSSSTKVYGPSTYASSNSGVTSKWANLPSSYSSSNSGVTPDMTNRLSTDSSSNSGVTPDRTNQTSTDSSSNSGVTPDMTNRPSTDSSSTSGVTPDRTNQPSTDSSSNSRVTPDRTNQPSTDSSSNSRVTPDMTNQPSTDLPYNSASTPDWNPVHPDYICIQYAKINKISPPISTPETTYAPKLNIVKKFKPTVHEATHSLMIGSIVLLSMVFFLGFICILDCPRVGHPKKISSKAFTSNS